MIETIYKKLKEYLVDREDVALEIRMHPSVFNECMNCDYHEVESAFNLSPSLNPNSTFNYRLVIDYDFDENEWKIQSPRFKHNLY